MSFGRFWTDWSLDVPSHHVTHDCIVRCFTALVTPSRVVHDRAPGDRPRGHGAEVFGGGIRQRAQANGHMIPIPRGAQRGLVVKCSQMQ